MHLISGAVKDNVVNHGDEGNGGRGAHKHAGGF